MKNPLTALFTLLASCAPMMSSKPSSPSTSPISPPHRVVMVHGFMETGSTFAILQDRLEEKGVVCLVPRLTPCDGQGGLEKLAEGLKRDIDQAFGPTEPITLIGFSMGGVVSRYYLQHLGGAKRCTQLITVASPHQGTKAAWLYPSKGAEQMRPGSEFLTDLAQTESHLGSMKLVSYRTRLDLIIVPSTNSIWDRAENIEHPSWLHPLLLISPTVIQDIERRVLENHG